MKKLFFFKIVLIVFLSLFIQCKKETKTVISPEQLEESSTSGVTNIPVEESVLPIVDSLESHEGNSSEDISTNNNSDKDYVGLDKTMVAVINCFPGYKEKEEIVSDTGHKEEEGDDIFTNVHIQAGPIGGMAEFNETFISRFRTPDIDSSVKRIEVIVQFVVEKDGSFTDINVLRDPGYGAGKETKRVLMEMPNWKPAVQDGKTVRSRFTLPIIIQVQ